MKFIENWVDKKTTDELSPFKNQEKIKEPNKRLYPGYKMKDSRVNRSDSLG